MISQFDLGWLVGIMEGEGSFALSGNSVNKQPRLFIQSTDRDVVLRAATILGGQGFVLERKKKILHDTYGKKTVYVYGVASSLAVYWMKILLPHMGARRQEQIKAVLLNYKPSSRVDKRTVYPSIQELVQ